MKRQEIIDFLDYLTKKEKITAEPIIACAIRASADGEDAYERVAHVLCGAHWNREQKRLPCVRYSEDMLERLLARGESMLRAEHLTRKISEGAYKAWYESVKDGTVTGKDFDDIIKPLEGDEHIFAMASELLPSREKIISLLKLEWEAYITEQS